MDTKISTVEKEEKKKEISSRWLQMDLHKEGKGNA